MRDSGRPDLVLVDGTNLLWRAAYGFPARITTRDNVDVTAPFGFFALLRKALREWSGPSECIVIFDTESSWNGRQQLLPEYKQHRLGVDAAPLAWLPKIQQGLNLQQVGWEDADGWEADDVIATVARRARTRRVVLMSTDRDYHQLLGPRILQLNTSRAAHRRVVTELDVIERYRVRPEQWCDYVALVGDRSDGIPGVAGIGRIRAARLLAGGLSLDDLDNSERLASHSYGLRLRTQLQQARAWRALVRFNTRAVTSVHPTGRTTPEMQLARIALEELEIW